MSHDLRRRHDTTITRATPLVRWPRHCRVFLRLGLFACDDTVAPTTGSIDVTASTAGSSIDPDGYLVALQPPPTPVPSARVPSNGSVVLTDLAPGDYSVELSDIASNCTIEQGNVIAVSVEAGGQAHADFAVTCITPLPFDLVFEATLPDTGPLQSDIYRVNASGAALRNLTASPDQEQSPVWKPDGSRIAFTGGASFSLMMMDSDGGNVTDLGVFFVPEAWSPDGSRLTGVNNSNDRFVINSDGTGLTNLTNRVCTPGAECGHVPASSWSPDGTHIVFGVTAILVGPPSACWVIKPDGTEATKVKEHCLTPAWAPNGDRIAFVGDEALSGHIMLTNPDGTGTVDLGSVYGADASDQMPSWSPDGSQIAFVRNPGAPSEPNKLFIMNADGTGLRQVPLSSGFLTVRHPTWGPAAP